MKEMIIIMTPDEFTERWKKISQSGTVQFRLRSPLAQGLNPDTAAALKDYGLPNAAGSWLEFGEAGSIPDAVFSDLEGRNLFPIGKLGFDCYICIDKNNDSIAVYSESDTDDLWLMNSSLNALYESIVIFESFITEVNRRNPNYQRDYRIPDGMLMELEASLTACDPEAIRAKSYWSCQVSSLDNGTL